MCKSRRALDENGADTAENEPLEDYRLRIQQPRRPKTQPYIGRSVAQHGGPRRSPTSGGPRRSRRLLIETANTARFKPKRV